MALATKLPTSSELNLFQYSRPDDPAPKLAAPLNDDDTVITVTVPLKDNDGVILTGEFHAGIRKTSGWTETVWVPADAVSDDGLTWGTEDDPVVRGIKPGGYDFTVGDSDFARDHDADEPVFCNVIAIIPELLRSALQGLIASGGSNFIIGQDSAGTVTVSRSTGTGTYVGFMRWYTTSGKVEYSNNGSVWSAISDATASVLFKIAATDTTPGYAKDKIIAGTGITITQTNTGSNETLVITTSLPTTISSHAIYTPAYMTGGNSAESNYLLWLGTSDGSVRFTIDGVVRNLTGLNFTTGVASMANVATKIQTALRALTGSTETVVWSTNHFIVTSANTTSASQVSVASATGGGTDISGAGAFAGMDSDTGNGTATAAVLDPTQDSGKIDLLDANGLHKAEFMPTNLQEANTAFGLTDITGTELETVSSGPTSNADTIHTHNNLRDWAKAAFTFTRVNLVDNYNGATASGGTVTKNNGSLVFIQTAATNGSNGYSYHAFDSNFYNVNAQFFARVALATTTVQDAVIGLFSGASSNPANGTLVEDHAAFIVDDNTVYASVANGTTQTKSSSLGISMASPHNFYIEMSGSHWLFYVDGSLVYTSTTNEPNSDTSAAGGLIIARENSAKSMIIYRNILTFDRS